MSTPYMYLTLPTVGPLGTQGPEWANEINSALSLVDGHDHSTGKGKTITPAGININQTLQMNSNQLSEIASLALDNLISQPASASMIYEYGGELYFNDGSANQVQLTSGGAINVASLGTITGDYSTSTADLTYSDLAKVYVFKQSATLTANISTGPISIFDNSVGSKYGKLKIDAAQASNLDWTLPAVFPASTLPLKSSNAGVLTTDQIQTADIADSAITEIKIADSSVTSAKIANNSIVNADINSSAAIQYSKLNLALSIVDNDINPLTSIQRSSIGAPGEVPSSPLTASRSSNGTLGTITWLAGISNVAKYGMDGVRGVPASGSYFYLTAGTSNIINECLITFTFSAGLTHLNFVKYFSTAGLISGQTVKFDMNCIDVLRFGYCSVTSGSVTLTVSGITSFTTVGITNGQLAIYQKL